MSGSLVDRSISSGEAGSAMPECHGGIATYRLSCDASRSPYFQICTRMRYVPFYVASQSAVKHRTCRSGLTPPLSRTRLKTGRAGSRKRGTLTVVLFTTQPHPWTVSAALSGASRQLKTHRACYSERGKTPDDHRYRFRHTHALRSARPYARRRDALRRRDAASGGAGAGRARPRHSDAHTLREIQHPHGHGGAVLRRARLRLCGDGCARARRLRWRVRPSCQRRHRWLRRHRVAGGTALVGRECRHDWRLVSRLHPVAHRAASAAAPACDDRAGDACRSVCRDADRAAAPARPLLAALRQRACQSADGVGELG